MHGLRTANQARQRVVWHGDDAGGLRQAEASTVAARPRLLFRAFGRLDHVRHERWHGIHPDGQEEDEQPAEYSHTGASYHGLEAPSLTVGSRQPSVA